MATTIDDRASNEAGSVAITSALEAPSGKGPADENFPVGSFLIAKRLRPHVARFYAFARAIDDIADNPRLTSDDKIRRLDLFDRALAGEADAEGTEKAQRLRESLRETGVDIRHGRNLIAAFRQDAIKARYASWHELMAYCELSANPVGRYLLDLHGEQPAAYAASDALCSVLQILNHLQDCGDDRRRLDRIYVPESFLQDEGADIRDFDAAALTPALRRVIDRMLAECETLLETARALPAHVRDRRLAMEAAVILSLAERLTHRLYADDPLADRVSLSKLDFAAAGVRGVVRGLSGAIAASRSRR